MRAMASASEEVEHAEERESALTAARRVDAIGGGGASFAAHVAPKGAVATIEASAKAGVTKSTDALADAISVVSRAAVRGGQPAGVVRRIEAEAVSQIHKLLCGVQDADAQPIVGVEAAQ